VLECNVAESLASGSAWCAFGPSVFTEHPCINVKARAERLSALASVDASEFAIVTTNQDA
jgi:hypothetical protein